jgi:hypothetical protein
MSKYNVQVATHVSLLTTKNYIKFMTAPTGPCFDDECARI